jgi:type I restriction enzyme S subunit
MAERRVLSLSYGRIIVKPDEKLHGLVPESFETYQIVNPGDIVIRSTDLQNDWNSLRVGLVRQRGIITSAYICLNVVGPLVPEYGYQQLNALDLMKVFYGMGSGLRQNLDFSDFKRMPILVPAYEEQLAIVRFLEHTDRPIRRYIGAKRRLIELLNEQKQAIIQRAVTRGLDPNVRVKPSGIEWLGDVPEHWITKPAKYVVREVDERSSSGTEELLSVSHITGVSPRRQKNVTMFMAASYVGHKLCRPGDVVINTMWAWMGALGVAGQTGIVSPSYAVYRLRKFDAFVAEFLDCLLRTKPYVSEYVCRSTGIRSSRVRLYPEQFLQIPLIQPPREEQRKIVGDVRQETRELDAAITRASREIVLVREYRTRLIADVVTGKLDVRSVELPQLEEAEELPPVGDEIADDATEEEGEIEPVEEMTDAAG